MLIIEHNKIMSLVKNKIDINYYLTLSIFHVEIISTIKSKIKV